MRGETRKKKQLKEHKKKPSQVMFTRLTPQPKI
jgi:hypothetical protein